MKSALTWLVPVVALVVGVGIGRLDWQDSKEKSDLHDQFSKIAEVDMEEYSRLKDQEQKYQKADEILGKIVQIFLADLGLRVTDAKIHLAKLQATGSGAQIAAEAQAVAAQPMRGAEMSRSQSGSKVASAAAVPSTSEWQKAESRLSSIENDQDADKFLKDARIPDFLAELKTSNGISSLDSVTQAILGKYAGEIAFQDGSGTLWGMSIEADGRIENQKLVGKELIVLSKDGQPFSTTKGSGDIKAFRKFAGGSSAVLMEIADSYYFQLYYQKEQDAFIGNFYQKGDGASYPFKGTVHLTKQ